jgi:hypothetical protein
MHIWTALGAREAALAAVLLLIGAGPASLLSSRFDGAARFGLAPVLGFCLGTCVTTTLLEFAPVGDTYWILIPLAIASTGFAAWRTLRARGGLAWPSRFPLRDVAQVLLVCVAVAAPLNYALHERHSVGPAAYYYTDVDNYVALQDVAKTTSLADGRSMWEHYERTGERFAELGKVAYSLIAFLGTNLDATPLDANVTALLGLGASDTYSPFLIVLLLAGALGAFACVRRVTGSDSWLAVLCGALFGGPFFLELWFDSYQAAIVALALVLPAMVLGWEALNERRAADLALFALVLAATLSVYPLFVPLLAAVGGLAIAWRALAERRAGASVREFARALAAPVAAVVVMTAAFNPIGLRRDITYYQKLLNDEIPLPRVGFKLPLDILPGWLLQTREFWYMPSLGVGGFKQILFGALIPAALGVFVVVGIVRHRFAIALVALAGLCGIAAVYAYSSEDACTYCAERYLLPLAPILALLLALGLFAVMRLPSRRWKALGAAGAVLAVIAVGQRARVELDRFIDGSYFLDSANRSVLAELPGDRGAVQVEGYGASVAAQAEQPLVYHLASERAPGRVSISLGSNVGNAIAYLDFGAILPPGPEFRADYRYVLTRFPGVQTNRQVIARSGGIALQRRTQTLDVTPYAGFGIEMARVYTAGVPYVTAEPMGFHVVGTDAGPVWARLTFHAALPAEVAPKTGVRSRLVDGTLTVCARATGQAPIRKVTFQLTAPPTPGALRLAGMHAVAGGCSVE